MSEIGSILGGGVNALRNTISTIARGKRTEAAVPNFVLEVDEGGKIRTVEIKDNVPAAAAVHRGIEESMTQLYDSDGEKSALTDVVVKNGHGERIAFIRKNTSAVGGQDSEKHNWHIGIEVNWQALPSGKPAEILSTKGCSAKVTEQMEIEAVDRKTDRYHLPDWVTVSHSLTNASFDTVNTFMDEMGSIYFGAELNEKRFGSLGSSTQSRKIGNTKIHDVRFKTPTGSAIDSFSHSIQPWGLSWQFKRPAGATHIEVSRARK